MGPPSATLGRGTITCRVTAVRFAAMEHVVHIDPAAVVLVVLSILIAGAMTAGALLLVG
jgi:hypothetical protein